MKEQKLGVDQLTIDSRLQARVTINQDAIDNYTEAYKAHAKMPPLEVVYDKESGRYYIVDGMHRHPAAVRAKIAKLLCNVEKGNFTYALIRACGANAENGVHRSNEDKRKAVRVLLDHPETAGQSDNWLATKCHVSPHTVKSVREAVQTGKCKVEHATSNGRDGKVRPASKAKATEQREAVARFLEEKPDATVREIAEETGASVGTVQNVKTSAASIVLDALEIPVPPDLREHHELRITLAKVGRELDKYRKIAKELAEQPGGEWLRLQDIDAGIRALKGHFQDAGYHTVCPSCKGAKRKNCQKCHGRAFVPEYMKGMVTT